MKVTRKGWMGEWEEEVPDEIHAEVLGDGSLLAREPGRYLPSPAKIKLSRVEQCRLNGRRGGRPRGSTKMQMLWDQAIVALLTYPSAEQAAKALGVSGGTLREWLKNPLFLEQLDSAHRQRIAHATLALQGNMGAIVQNLLDIAYDKDKSDTSRIAAMKLMLDKISDIQQHERAENDAKARVDRLEKVKDEIIAGRLGGEDLALPEGGEANDLGDDGEPGPAGAPLAEDDGAARGGAGEADGGYSEAGASGADE